MGIHRVRYIGTAAGLGKDYGPELYSAVSLQRNLTAYV